MTTSLKTLSSTAGTLDDSNVFGPVVVDLGAAGTAATTVLGSAFNDLLTGSPAGGDALVGNAGNDTLVSTGSRDTLTGGAGGDVFSFASATASGGVIADFQSTTDRLEMPPAVAPA